MSPYPATPELRSYLAGLSPSDYHNITVEKVGDGAITPYVCHARFRVDSKTYFTAFARATTPQLEDVMFARWLLGPESPWWSITKHQRNSLEDVVYGGFYFDSTDFEKDRSWWLNFLCVSRMVREVPAIVATWAQLVAFGVEPCLAFVATLDIVPERNGLYFVGASPSVNDHHMPWNTRAAGLNRIALCRNLRGQNPRLGGDVWFTWIQRNKNPGDPVESLWSGIARPKTPASERKSLTGMGRLSYTLGEIAHHLLNNVEPQIK